MLASFSILAWMPGPLEIALIAGVALIIFGRRLPDVARSMGKSIVEFKKGLKDVQTDVDQVATEDTGRKALPSAEGSQDKPDKAGD